MHQRTSLGSVGIATSVIVLVAIAASCSTAGMKGPGGGGTDHVAGTSTCGPGTEARKKLIGGGDRPDSIAAWATWDIPEYQDEQKFTNRPNASGRYGPLVCVVAAVGLASIPASATGVVMAMAWVGGDIPATANNPYSQLHLSKGYNCVIIRTQDQQRTGFIVPIVDRDCGPVNEAEALVVHMASEADAGPVDYPPVARFVEKTNWRMMIGVACQNSWCNIGDTPANREARAHDVPSPASRSTPGYIRHAVFGWHDQQRLAVAYPPSTDIHATLDASVVPDDSLQYWTQAAHWTTKRLAAKVYFKNGDNPEETKYATNWGMTNYGSNNPNTIELRLTDVTHPEIKTNWEVWINNVHKPNLRVTYTAHPGVTIPATARFRWKETDEDVWVACIIGCCLVDES